MPSTYQEALEHLYEDEYMILAGGTDLMIQNRSWSETPVAFRKNVMYLSHVKELNYIEFSKTHIHIGACVTLETIKNHPYIPRLLKEVILEMASPAIRHVATLVGNVGNASPAGDSLVVLYLLDASVVLGSLFGEKEIMIKDFIFGPRKILMESHQMIKEIKIPVKTFTMTKFVKVGGRLADAISKVSFAGAVTVENQKITQLRLAWGAVYQTVVRNLELERKYTGITVEALKGKLPQLIQDYSRKIVPIDDQRSNKKYRKKVAINLLESFIQSIEG